MLVDALLTDLGPQTFTRRAEMVRAAAGCVAEIGEWDWEASLQKSQDDAVTVRSGELGSNARCERRWRHRILDDALNPFGGSGANSPALLASLLAPPSQSHFRTEAIQSVASVRGPLASLPAGALELTAGGEWREERVRYDIAGRRQTSPARTSAPLLLRLASCGCRC